MSDRAKNLIARIYAAQFRRSRHKKDVTAIKRSSKARIIRFLRGQKGNITGEKKKFHTFLSPLVKRFVSFSMSESDLPSADTKR
jgi:hypothetical protein